jgi:DNA polymerase Ligase (LigD)
MPRFVILCHALPSGERHWDFMLEFGRALRTWALSEEPAPGRDIAAKTLPDHRLEYLDYEGPISEGRGDVARWDSGDFDIEIDQPCELVVRLRGTKLDGLARLRANAAEAAQWHFSYSV